jgi:hypothetical protein
MPKAPVPAALAALAALARAGLGPRDVDAVTTHNPFAVNDLWFSQQTGIALERMNAYGCSLIYGHPQGPTGARLIVELLQTLRLRGGGIGLFTAAPPVTPGPPWSSASRTDSVGGDPVIGGGAMGPSGGAGRPEGLPDELHGVMQVGLAGDGQRSAGSVGEPALVDAVFVRVRRAGVQHLEFLAAVGVGDHGHSQVRARGQADGEVAEPGRGETFGLVPDLLGFRAGQDRLADGDHAYFLPIAPAGRPPGM